VPEEGCGVRRTDHGADALGHDERLDTLAKGRRSNHTRKGLQRRRSGVNEQRRSRVSFLIFPRMHTIRLRFEIDQKTGV